jgi:hypothetical protein
MNARNALATLAVATLLMTGAQAASTTYYVDYSNLSTTPAAGFYLRNYGAVGDDRVILLASRTNYSKMFVGSGTATLRMAVKATPECQIYFRVETYISNVLGGTAVILSNSAWSSPVYGGPG